MSFIEIVDQVIELLRNRRRISYRVLRREFDLVITMYNPSANRYFQGGGTYEDRILS